MGETGVMLQEKAGRLTAIHLTWVEDEVETSTWPTQQTLGKPKGKNQHGINMYVDGKLPG